MNFMRYFKVICVFVAVLAATRLYADYLYWQVDQANLGGQDFVFNGARVVAVLDTTGESSTIGSYYYVSAGDDGHRAGEYVRFADGYVDFYPDPNEELTTGDVYADLGDLGGDGYYYFIELINYDDTSKTFTQVATSEKTTWADLQGSITSDLAPEALAPWHGTGFTGAVPEPTSGILVLLGVGVAAFKKRRTLKDWLKRKG